ncbi:hypothetical protein JCM10213_009182 [Rhodosporidiobolus nylandii]
MVLKRSDSAQSAWFAGDGPASTADPQGDIPDQRRIRHLHSILVRNLTLLPEGVAVPSALPEARRRPRSLSPTSGRRGGGLASPGLVGAQEPSSARKGKSRRRAGSTASWSGTFGSVDEGNDGANERELVLDGLAQGSSTGRTRPRRSSSAGTLLTRLYTPRIEEEPASLSSPSSPSKSTPFPPASTPPTQTRARSTSRLSSTSAASTSTVREAPRLPSSRQPPPAERPPPPNSAQFARREKERRGETMRKRLLDSFVSLELLEPRAAEENGFAQASVGGRKRGQSVLLPRHPAASRMRRSDSAGSGSPSSDLPLATPRKAMRRRRTLSSSLVPTTSSFASTSSPAATLVPSRPFFVSAISHASTHPTFPVDRDAFIPPLSTSATSSAAAELDESDRVASWEGLRENRVRAKIFVRSAGVSSEPAADEKGKAKAKEQSENGDESWECLVEWDVALDGLVSLGRDPTAFPSLPPNTLIFALSPSSPHLPFASPSSATSSSSDIEYFTAPLPLLHRSLARSHLQRHSRRRSDSRGAVSEDDLSSGCSSCESDDLDLDGEDGNLSDPGVGHARSGTLTLRTRREARKRARAERLRAAEERRRRREVVEKSRRETRMVQAAAEGDVRELWQREKEVGSVRTEAAEVRARVEMLLREGWEEAQRERAELQDRVEDLAQVQEAVDEEVADERAALAARRAALSARRARLEAAKMLEEENREGLEQKGKELETQEDALSTLLASLSARRTQLCTLLSSLFPIEPVSPSPSLPEPPHMLFSLHSLALPNSSFSGSSTPRYSDEHLSSALGYCASLVTLLAAYLRVPLVYPVRARGSRSTVTDPISMMKGPRAFPLYGKGVEQYRFDYGVFLLNKDIEQVRPPPSWIAPCLRLVLPPPLFSCSDVRQKLTDPFLQLMYSRSLTVLDLRNTLPNLKTLLLSLSYDPSHPAYSSCTLQPAWPFLTSEADESGVLDGDERDRSPSPADSSSVESASEGTAESTPASSTSSLPALSLTAPPTAGATRMSRSPSLASTIRPSSPASTLRGGVDDPHSVVSLSSGANRIPLPAAEAGKECRPSLPSPPSPPAPMKIKLKARSRSRSGSGGEVGTASVGYGRRLADGLWTAVAGSMAVSAGKRGEVDGT